MAHEIDEVWIDEAMDRYRRLEALQRQLDRAVATHVVSVHSPDDSIEIAVTASGRIIDVRVHGSLHHRNPVELAREIKSVITSADEAARWAREKLHTEVFGKSRTLGED